VVRNGANTSGTPTFRCRGCGRRFVAAPLKGPVSGDRRELVERLLGERMSLRGVARATGHARSWVQEFANALYRERTPHTPGRLKKMRAT
jgi:transposase-like protein